MVDRNDIFQQTFLKFQGFNREQLLGKLDIHFEGEEGVDAGGLRREFYYKISQVLDLELCIDLTIFRR
jgi:hypothetical protein